MQYHRLRNPEISNKLKSGREELRADTFFGPRAPNISWKSICIKNRF